MGKKKPAAKRRRPNLREWREERRRFRARKRVADALEMGALTKAEADEYYEEISIGDFVDLWNIFKEIMEWIREWLRNR